MKDIMGIFKDLQFYIGLFWALFISERQYGSFFSVLQ
jgi:hypothetical protein